MTSVDQLQRGFVLHTRPFRETSLLIDIITEDHGRLGLCARGVRNKKSPKRSLLQPLSPLFLCWKGRGDLLTLTVVELAGPAIKLSGDALYSAFYINELLVRLLHRHDPYPELFHHYQQTLQQLTNPDTLEQTLRKFELELLTAIGYGLTLNHDLDGEPICDENNYLLNVAGLFQRAESNLSLAEQRLFSGRHLISIANNNWESAVVLKDAKRLLRLSLKPLLGDKPLQSRKLFRRKLS